MEPDLKKLIASGKQINYRSCLITLRGIQRRGLIKKPNTDFNSLQKLNHQKSDFLTKRWYAITRLSRRSKTFSSCCCRPQLNVDILH